MSRFKIGQKVVALTANATGELVKGKTYEVCGFSACKGCGEPTIYLVGMVRRAGISHPKCGTVSETMRENYLESFFAPLQNTADAIEYRLSVSIPELIEVKEYQSQ